MASYVPSTKEERQAMLSAVGVEKAEDLFAHISPEVLLTEPLDIPAGMSLLEAGRRMEEMAAKNRVFSQIFRGAGAYNHYVPAQVRYITSKEEFLTSYTPYQAEISQGVLQSIFEYQTMICELTGMDVSNASVYDGATAAAEAVAMCRERKRDTALVSELMHPDTLEVIGTYCEANGMKVELIPEKDGVTDLEKMKAMMSETTACVLVSQPNFYGRLEDAAAIGAAAHEGGAKYIVSVNPISLGILKPPAEYGADIAVGEGQPLGMPLSFGGPYLGFMAATKQMMRKLPGRIVGQTEDVDGRRAFVLTLQAREQHIRREKASSNICSNQALCAMTAAVYLTVMGPEGLAETARQCMSKAHYAAAALEKAGCMLKYKGEYFHEFVTTTPIPASRLMAVLEEKGILGGLPLSEDEILWCVTEVSTRADIDRMAAAVTEAVKTGTASGASGDRNTEADSAPASEVRKAEEEVRA